MPLLLVHIRPLVLAALERSRQDNSPAVYPETSATTEEISGGRGDAAKAHTLKTNRSGDEANRASTIVQHAARR